MISVDTSFLVALVRDGDQLSARARAWASRIKESWLFTDYVIVEAVNALSSPRNRPKTHRLLKQTRDVPGTVIVPASAELFDEGLRLHAARPDKEGRSPTASRSSSCTSKPSTAP